MIFTTLLSITHTLILLLIKVAILYFLIKAFDKKINISTVCKFILSYELIAFLILSFYSSSLEGKVLYQYGGKGNLTVLLSIFILFCLVLFLTFNFLSKKFIALEWKKIIVIFIAINLIAPVIDFALIITTQPIYDMPIFQKEMQEMDRMMEEKGVILGFLEFQKKRPIIEKINARINASLTGVKPYFFNVIVGISK